MQTATTPTLSPPAAARHCGGALHRRQRWRDRLNRASGSSARWTRTSRTEKATGAPSSRWTREATSSPAASAFAARKTWAAELAASFWLEMALLRDTGEVQGVGFQRRSTVSLSHNGVGEVRLGRLHPRSGTSRSSPPSAPWASAALPTSSKAGPSASAAHAGASQQLRGLLPAQGPGRLLRPGDVRPTRRRGRRPLPRRAARLDQRHGRCRGCLRRDAGRPQRLQRGQPGRHLRLRARKALRELLPAQRPRATSRST